MKIIKRFGLVILGFAALAFIVSAFLPAHQANAATEYHFSKSDIQKATVNWVNITHIYLLIHGQKVDFYVEHGGSTYASKPLTYITRDTGGNNQFCTPNSTIQNESTTRSQYAEISIFGPWDSSGNPLPQTKAYVFTAANNADNNNNLYYGPSNSSDCNLIPRVLPTDLTVHGFNAAPPGDTLAKIKSNIQASSFSFTDGYHISMRYKGDGKTYTLFDTNPFDETPNFAFSGGQPFCKGVDGVNLKISSYGDLIKNSVAASIKFAYMKSNPGGDPQYICTADSSSVANIAIQNSGQLATKLFTWNGTKISNLAGSNNQTLSQNSQDKTVYESDTSGACGGGWVIKLPNDGASSGTLYRLIQDSKGGVGNIGSVRFSSCSLESKSPIADFGKRVILIAGARSTGGGGGGGGGGGNTAEADCEGNAQGLAGGVLQYAMCPMLVAADDMSVALTNVINNLLNFNVNGSLNNSPTEKAWSNMRDLASVFLVVVMLVMVLSQAVSWGAFDAYTVRKVLPRLVIAVILMQLSWGLLEYLIRLSNDLGHGIANLLELPFTSQDPQAFQLTHLLAQGGVGNGEAAAVSWVALLTVGAIAILSLPTLVLMGWSVVLALGVGFIVLVFRQILIVASMIFAPIAIFCWIIPGTQKYWKLWYDNFTKLLLMFPMIIGLLTVGKIFAYITGNSDHGGSLITFLFILLGYFGPYFLLPKTYKWGGQAMAAFGQAASNAAPKLGGPVTNFLKGQQERSKWNLSRQRRKEQLMRNAQDRWSAGMGMGGVRGRVNRTRGAGLRSVGLPGRASRLTPWVQGDRDVRHRIASGAESVNEKLHKEEAQEELAHLKRQENFRNGNYGDIERMGLGVDRNGTPLPVTERTSAFRREALLELIRARRAGEIRNIQATNPEQFEEDMRYLASQDEAGRIRDAMGDEGMGIGMPE